MKRACPQLRTTDLVVRYGFTARHWTKLPAAVRIPGSSPCGPRGHWSFDAQLFAVWWEAGKREAAQCRISTNGAKPIGTAPSVRDASIVEASRQRIEQLLNAVSASGSKNSR